MDPRAGGLFGNQAKWTPGGLSIGWCDASNVYLEPNAVLAAANSFASRQGQPFTVTSRTLYKRLAEKEALETTDSVSTTIRLNQVPGRPRALHVKMALLV